MNPVIVQVGPFIIRWYGVMMALTILASIWFANRWAPHFGVDRVLLDRIALWLVITIFVGARLGYVLSHLLEFRDPLEILRVWHGGLSSHGAIVAGLLFVYAVARRTGVSMWSLADIAAWAIPLGNIFVRFGNFMNGELYGDPTTLPWGITFPDVDEPRHPLQFYEMIFAVVILLVALRVSRRRAYPGQVWWVIVVLTSVGRIFLDALRSDDHVLWGTFAYGQVAAVVLAAVGLWFLWRRPTAAERAAAPPAVAPPPSTAPAGSPAEAPPAPPQ